jgi:hypothetical protein
MKIEATRLGDGSKIHDEIDLKFLLWKKKNM